VRILFTEELSCLHEIFSRTLGLGVTSNIYFYKIIAVWGAYENFLCPRDPAQARNASVVFFPCIEDCKHQHGAVDGTCGDASKGDINCYCGKLTGSK
jgi:hypothetical protein